MMVTNNINSLLSFVLYIFSLTTTTATATATSTNIAVNYANRKRSSKSRLNNSLRGTLVESFEIESKIITTDTKQERKIRFGDMRSHHRELGVKCKEIEVKKERKQCKQQKKARKAAKKAAKEAKEAAEATAKEQGSNNQESTASGRTETQEEVEKEDSPLPDHTTPQDLVRPPDYTPPANESKTPPKAGGANSQLARQYWTKMPPNDIWLQVSIPKNPGSTDDTCLPGSGTSPCPVAVENRDGIKSVTEYCENSHECDTGCCMQIRLENAWTFSHVCLYHEATPWNTCVYGTTAPVEEESTAISGRSGNGKGEFEACEASSECASRCCFNYGGEMGIGCLKTDNPEAMGDLCIIGEVGVGSGTGGALGGRSDDGDDGDSNTGAALGGASDETQSAEENTTEDERKEEEEEEEEEEMVVLKYAGDPCTHSKECRSDCCADVAGLGLVCAGTYYDDPRCIH